MGWGGSVLGGPHSILLSYTSRGNAICGQGADYCRLKITGHPVVLLSLKYDVSVPSAWSGLGWAGVTSYLRWKWYSLGSRPSFERTGSFYFLPLGALSSHVRNLTLLLEGPCGEALRPHGEEEPSWVPPSCYLSPNNTAVLEGCTWRWEWNEATMDWICVSSPNSCVGAVIFNVMILGRGTFERLLGHEGGALMKEMSVL